MAHTADYSTFVGIFCKNKVTVPYYFEKTINDCLSKVEISTWQQILKYSNLELHHVEKCPSLSAEVKLSILRDLVAVIFP